MTKKLTRKLLKNKKILYDTVITVSSAALVLYCAITTYAVLYILALLVLLRLAYLIASFRINTIADQYQLQTNDMPEFSIIICSYNESKENLDNLFQSIANSTVKAKQIIVVDDGSKEPVVIDKRYKNFELVRNPGNSGKKRCQAIGLALLHPTDYILYLDSDVLFDADAIETSLRFIKNHTDGNIFGVRIRIKDFKSDYLNTFINTSYHSDYNKRLFESYYGATISCNGAFMFCRYGFMKDNLSKYLNETFMGRPLITGNDKSLTNLALQSGKSYTIPGVTITHERFEFKPYLKKIQRTFKTSIIYQARTILLKNVHPLVRFFSVVDLFSFFVSVPLQVVFFIALLQLPYFYVYAGIYIIILAVRNNRSVLNVLQYALFRYSFTILLYLLRILTLFRIRSIGWGNR